MTRINVGIDPQELCDQHLVAEYRELPRVFDFSPKGFVPDKFTLGRGHVNWCAQWQSSLRIRQHAICEEMEIRGITVNYYQQYPVINVDQLWTLADEQYARPILIKRIQDRLYTMKRTPRWTARPIPEWVAIEDLAY